MNLYRYKNYFYGIYGAKNGRNLRIYKKSQDPNFHDEPDLYHYLQIPLSWINYSRKDLEELVDIYGKDLK